MHKDMVRSSKRWMNDVFKNSGPKRDCTTVRPKFLADAPTKLIDSTRQTWEGLASQTDQVHVVLRENCDKRRPGDVEKRQS